MQDLFIRQFQHRCSHLYIYSQCMSYFIECCVLMIVQIICFCCLKTESEIQNIFNSVLLLCVYIESETPICVSNLNTEAILLSYYGKRKQVTKMKFLVKILSKMCLSLALTSMEYHDVLPNISLSRMSVYAQNLAWKKSTLGKIQKHQ